MYEYPGINVLSIETSSPLNVETKPRMQWHGDGETEPMEHLCQPLCTFECKKVIMHECPHTFLHTSNVNKNGFQWDAYYPLQWPSQGWCVYLEEGCLPKGGVSA